MGRLVAIVGRPNVGKSTLFNRLTQTRAAIVNDTSGTTRDRQYGKMDWNGMEMSVVDTGGWVVNSEDIFEGEINKQVQLAIEEADVILFVVDIKNGITDLDDHVAEILRRSGKKVIVVTNKDDNNESIYAEAEFYSLGLGKPFSISAINGTGTGDLLDEVVRLMPSEEGEEPEMELPRFAIVGRPNAGKSSLINSLMEQERNIVTDIAGTTRDAVDLPLTIEMDGQSVPIVLVDTAGLRRKGQISSVVEFFSANRTEQAIRRSDLVLFVLDTQDLCTTQERHIGRIIVDACRPCIMLANKWDILTKEGKNKPDLMAAHVRQHMPYLNHAPILTISAATG
ncbi:MAG: ribosome biogenesis GTPase Der, partial [Muribaculaceae bacterium]|nr:ribosome biogenesis GTPase Der [Muribaculaceae bacterium]